ncbi:MAG TPA: YqgE/AlgH family protein [Gemmataceae bacterium]|nr:YqgE/AlgH family protein [Gemmataceae bacterium]
MSLAGSFLIARPVLRDPNFAHTVVLILAHNEDGAFGLVVNRPAKVEKLAFPVFSGGPCPSPGLILLHGHADWAEEGIGAQQIAPGLFLGDPACLDRATAAAPETGVRLRAYQGYAGWGPGQLEGELAGGAWAVMPARGELLFDLPLEAMWQDLLPPRIPQPSLN